MIVLDTHVLVWWLAGDPALSATAREAIAAELGGGKIVVSAISAWEIAQLVERGRLALSMDVETWLSTAAEIEALHFLPVDVTVAAKSVALPGVFHKDPADRMIVATARKLGVALVTKDEKIRAYAHVKTLW